MGNANLVGYARAATAGCRNHFLQLWLSASAVVVLLLSPASFAGTPKEAITAAGVNVQTSTPLTSVRGQPRAATLSTVGDDIPVITGDTMTQSECSVFLDPNNPLVILNSNNSSNWAKLLSRDMYLYQVTRRYGAAAWVSTDGGQTWTGNVRGVGGMHGSGRVGKTAVILPTTGSDLEP